MGRAETGAPATKAAKSTATVPMGAVGRKSIGIRENKTAGYLFIHSLNSSGLLLMTSSSGNWYFFMSSCAQA